MYLGISLGNLPQLLASEEFLWMLTTYSCLPQPKQFPEKTAYFCAAGPWGLSVSEGCQNVKFSKNVVDFGQNHREQLKQNWKELNVPQLNKLLSRQRSCRSMYRYNWPGWERKYWRYGNTFGVKETSAQQVNWFWVCAEELIKRWFWAAGWDLKDLLELY